MIIEKDNIDFFDESNGILINTVNCEGVMGKGLALEFKKKYPKMFSSYKEACDNKIISPGIPHVYVEGFGSNKIIILNIPTKVEWRNNSKYEYILQNLIVLRKYLLLKPDIKEVNLPPLGCGNGGLDYSLVKDMMYSHLHDLSTTVNILK